MTITEPEHTFVILAYKESDYLEACVQSVLNQSVPSRVVIGTSTPNAHIENIAAKYKLEVKVNRQPNGIGGDWNFGLSCADTRYVTIAHQDDIYLPKFAETCLQLAHKYDGEKPLMVFTKSLTYIDAKEVFIGYKNILRWLLIMPFHFKQCIKGKFAKKSILLFSNSISCPGVFYVKANTPTFRFDEQLLFILDWKAWYDLSQMDGSFIYAPQALHIHREHGDSTTSKIGSDILQAEEYKLLSQIWGSSFMPLLISSILRMAK